MLKTFLLLSIIPFQFSYSDDKDLADVVNFLEDVTKTIPTGNIKTDCIECSTSTEKQTDQFCENLYEASCLTPEGKQRFENGHEEYSNTLRMTVNEARDKSAKKIGYNDFKDLITKKFKRLGFEISTPPSNEQWSLLFREESGNYWFNDNNIKFVSVEKCNTEKTSLDNRKFNITYIEQVKAFVSENEKTINKILATSIPNFMNDEIKNKCNNLKNYKNDYIEANNEKIFFICKNYLSIKTEAVNLFRLKGSKEYEEESIKFVKKYTTPDLVYNSRVLSKNVDESLKDDAENICDKLSKAMNEAAKDIAEDSLITIAKSKPAIDYLIDKIYTKERKEKSDQFMSLATDSILNLLSSLSSDTKKNTKIKETYSKLKLDWLTKPAATSYEIDPETGLQVLIDKNDPYDILDRFFDGNLTFFTEINAFYTTQLKNDQEVLIEEMVHMMPAFINMLETNPYSFLSTVAHEVGHKIGPNVSRENGHDLRTEWQDLLSCYSARDSIALVKGQEDETISDYLSSAVLSEVLERLPFNERRLVLISSMTDLCLFDDGKIAKYSLNCESEHPENSLRINGIYGSNPRLRIAVGCNEPSSQYRLCSLKKAGNK